MQTFFQIVLMQKFILALIILFLFFMWINHQGLCDAVPLVSSRWIVHLQSVQLLYTAPADGYGGVGEADGSSLCPAGAAGRRHPLLAGDGSAAAGAIAHRLSHTHLTERQLVCELMVLLEIQEEMLHLRCFEQEMCHNVCPVTDWAVLTVVFSRQCSRWWCWFSKGDLFFRHRALSLSRSWEIKNTTRVYLGRSIKTMSLDTCNSLYNINLKLTHIYLKRPRLFRAFRGS